MDVCVFRSSGSNIANINKTMPCHKYQQVVQTLALLTLFFSRNLVIMTTMGARSCQTIRQKSTTVFDIGP